MGKHFYSKYIPELEELAEKHKGAADPAKKAAAEKLGHLVEETLQHANHQWYLNQMDPAEKARRNQQRQEFQKRYAK